jgi:hypothetical protein
VLGVGKTLVQDPVWDPVDIPQTTAEMLTCSVWNATAGGSGDHVLIGSATVSVGDLASFVGR